jgi:hypothetical protein
MVYENIRYIGGPLNNQVRRIAVDNSYDVISIPFYNKTPLIFTDKDCSPIGMNKVQLVRYKRCQYAIHKFDGSIKTYTILLIDNEPDRTRAIEFINKQQEEFYEYIFSPDEKLVRKIGPRSNSDFYECIDKELSVYYVSIKGLSIRIQKGRILQEGSYDECNCRTTYLFCSELDEYIYTIRERESLFYAKEDALHYVSLMWKG